MRKIERKIHDLTSDLGYAKRDLAYANEDLERANKTVERLVEDAAKFSGYGPSSYTVKVWVPKDGDDPGASAERVFNDLALAVHWRLLKVNQMDGKLGKRASSTITESRRRAVNDEGKQMIRFLVGDIGIGSTIEDVLGGTIIGTPDAS